MAALVLLIDSVLTVSVSISAGVRAVTFAFPAVFPYRVYIALFAVLIIIWLNLCGMRNSCTTFAIPTYTFVACVLPMVIVGLVRYFHLFGVTPTALTQEVELPPSR
ncbi:MAG: hypothetical protein GX457_16410 [Thermotogaceae bacterium]|nr:hypothetical protein [Thermotogaceae bacterium]